MNEKPTNSWSRVIGIGLIGGAATIYLSLVGLVGIFGDHAVIEGLISLGHTLLLLTFLFTGYSAGRAVSGGRGPAVMAGGVGGAIAGAVLALLVIVGPLVDLRSVFPSASPLLYGLLTFDLGTGGFWVPVVVGLLLGALSALIDNVTTLVNESMAQMLGYTTEQMIGQSLFAFHDDVEIGPKMLSEAVKESARASVYVRHSCLTRSQARMPDVHSFTTSHRPTSSSAVRDRDCQSSSSRAATAEPVSSR